MKNHLKLIAAPKTWFVPRKTNVFTLRPSPGAHALEYGMPLGLLLEPGHYTRLNLIYWKTPNADAYGHRHRFIIRQGDGLFDSLFGDKVLNGVYDEKLVLGGGRREIVVHDLTHYGEIASAIRAANEEFGLDFLVRKIEEESFHRAKPLHAT